MGHHFARETICTPSEVNRFWQCVRSPERLRSASSAIAIQSGSPFRPRTAANLIPGDGFSFGRFVGAQVGGVLLRCTETLPQTLIFTWLWSFRNIFDLAVIVAHHNSRSSFAENLLLSKMLHFFHFLHHGVYAIKTNKAFLRCR